MYAIKKIGLTAALAAATTIGLGTGVAPASAAPTPTPGANLYIFNDPASHGNYRVTVKGVFPMSEYDAHGFINNINTGERPGGIEYNIHAEDPDGDPLIKGEFFPGAGKGPGAGYVVAEADGIHYHREFVVPWSALNEDDRVFDDTDEIYTRSTFVDGDGGNRHQYSNVVVNQF